MPFARFSEASGADTLSLLPCIKSIGIDEGKESGTIFLQARCTSLRQRAEILLCISGSFGFGGSLAARGAKSLGFSPVLIVTCGIRESASQTAMLLNLPGG